MCRPVWRCMVTEAIRSRMVWVITGVLALLVLLALPAKAESADYETTLDRLGRLQALAEQYIEEKNSGDDPIDLTLSFTRVGDYNTDIWQLTAACVRSISRRKRRFDLRIGWRNTPTVMPATGTANR